MAEGLLQREHADVGPLAVERVDASLEVVLGGVEGKRPSAELELAADDSRRGCASTQDSRNPGGSRC